MPDYLYDRKLAKFQGQLILNIAVQSMGCISNKVTYTNYDVFLHKM